METVVTVMMWWLAGFVFLVMAGLTVGVIYNSWLMICGKTGDRV